MRYSPSSYTIGFSAEPPYAGPQKPGIWSESKICDHQLPMRFYKFIALQKLN